MKQSKEFYEQIKSMIENLEKGFIVCENINCKDCVIPEKCIHILKNYGSSSSLIDSLKTLLIK